MKEEKEFKDLKREVVEKGICTICGACAAVCPFNALIPREETLKRLDLRELEVTPRVYKAIEEMCEHCGYCYYNCPQVMFNLDKAERADFGSVASNILGHYRRAYLARATDWKIRKNAQSGGATVALLHYALKKRIIRGAVVSKTMEDAAWKPMPVVATNLHDLIESQKTKYTPAAALLGIKSGIFEWGILKLGIVATPCQVHGIWTMRTSPRGVLKLFEAVKLVLGTFCYGTYTYNKLFLEFLVKKHGIMPSSITKIDLDTKRLKVHVHGELALNAHRHEIHEYLRGSCRKCHDFTNRLADISVGRVGAPEGWTVVLVRTERGENVFDEAIREGYLEVKKLPEESLKAAINLAQLKFEKGVEK